MDPFRPNSDWYERYWYSPKPAKLPWSVPAALVSMAAFVLVAWLS